MQTPVPSTLAQVLFEPSSSLNFARVVTELETVLTRLKPEGMRTSWDCDDLVFFDLAETRIGLGFAEVEEGPIASCLTISVGPRQLVPAALDTGFDVLCSRIVERIQSRYLPLAVLWHQTDEVVSSELIDRMTEDLPRLTEGLPPIDGILEPIFRATHAAATNPAPAEIADAVLAATPPSPFLPPDRLPHGPAHSRLATRIWPEAPAPANDMAPGALRHAEDLTRTRAALYDEAPEGKSAPMSTQMRLAVHCLNATLIMVWMPFGAAVMTYTLLKGEDIRLSARIMALTGTFLAFAQSPFGQSVAAAVAGTVSGA